MADGMTPTEFAEWQAWRKARKLEQQRARRQHYPRIDYYPSKEALDAIERETSAHPRGAGSDYASIINALILLDAKRTAARSRRRNLPE